MISAVAALAGAAAMHAQTPDARELARQAAARIKELQAEADRLASLSSSVLGQLRALEIDRALRGQEVAKADAELAAVAGDLAATSARVDALEAQRLAETPGVRERLVELYKRGRGGYARLLLAADDLLALGRLSRGIAAVAAVDQLRFETHRSTLRREQAAVAELETRRRQVAAAQADAARARAALDRAVAAHNAQLDELDRRRDLAARYVGELQAAQSELQRRVTALSGGAAPVLPLAPFRGSLEWPVMGPVASRFGRSTAGRFGTTILRNGIEIAASEGREVRAVHGGTVAYAAPFTGFGTLVIVDHGGNAFSLYGHLNRALVAQGARVGRGTVVGRSGRNPSGAAVVYFELRIDGRPVDPVQWLRSTR